MSKSGTVAEKDPFTEGVKRSERGPDFAVQAGVPAVLEKANPPVIDAEVMPEPAAGAMARMERDATDIGDIVPELPVFKAEDLRGQVIVLLGWKWHEGDKGLFAVADCVKIATGEQGVFVCGGTVVCQKLQMIEQRVRRNEITLPIKARLVLHAATKKGHSPMVDLISPSAPY